jgi:HAMP domain-containing protein
MNDLPDIVFGWLGTLLLAIGIVLGAALALQAWHEVQHRHRPGLASGLATGLPSHAPPASSYWSGRG